METQNEATIPYVPPVPGDTRDCFSITPSTYTTTIGVDYSPRDPPGWGQASTRLAEVYHTVRDMQSQGTGSGTTPRELPSSEESEGRCNLCGQRRPLRDKLGRFRTREAPGFYKIRFGGLERSPDYRKRRRLASGGGDSGEESEDLSGPVSIWRPTSQEFERPEAPAYSSFIPASQFWMDDCVGSDDEDAHLAWINQHREDGISESTTPESSYDIPPGPPERVRR